MKPNDCPQGTHGHGLAKNGIEHLRQSERVTESTTKLSTNLLHTNLDFISVCVWVVECVGEFKKKYICINTVICQGLNGRVRTV